MITPQSANFTTVIQQAARRPVVLALIEGLADPVCTVKPADQWSKTYALQSPGGDTDNVTFGTTAALTQLPEWTIGLWVKAYTAGGSSGMLIGSRATASARGYGISLAGGGTEIAAEYATGTKTSIGSGSYTTISDGSWHYVAVSVGGTNGTVVRAVIDSTDYGPYYDTTKTYTDRNTWTAATSFHMFGRTDGGGTAGDWSGFRIGYAVVFNRALTLDEMRRIKYRRIDKKWGDDDSGGLWDACVAEWQIERNAGTTVTNNRNPGTHDGTMGGSSSWQSDACFAVTYRDVLTASATSGQSIDPLATRTSIQSNTLQIGDHDEWLTALLYSTSLGILRKNVRMFLGFDALLESEYQPIYSGRIADIDFGPGHVYTLQVADAIFDTKGKITLGKGTLQSNITNVATTAQIEVSRYFTVLYDAESVYCSRVRIDSEIIGVPDLTGSSASVQLLGNTSSAPHNLQRGNLGSTAAAHNAPAPITELLCLTNIAGPTGQAPYYAVLTLLLSAAGFYASSLYDVLTESAYSDATTHVRRGRGAAMSPSDVAVGEIAALTSPANAIEVIVEDDVEDVKDFIETQILRGAGWAFYVKADGRLSVFDAASIPVLADSVYDLTPDRVYRARMRVSEGDVVNLLSITYDYDPLTQETANTYVAADATSGTKFGARRRTYEIPAFTNSTDVATLATNILARFKNPLVTFEIECGLYESLLEIGDAVTFTDYHLPNLSVGVRGVTQILCQIVGRQVDYVRGLTRLTLVDVSRM